MIFLPLYLCPMAIRVILLEPKSDYTTALVKALQWFLSYSEQNPVSFQEPSKSLALGSDNLVPAIFPANFLTNLMTTSPNTDWALATLKYSQKFFPMCLECSSLPDTPLANFLSSIKSQVAQYQERPSQNTLSKIVSLFCLHLSLYLTLYTHIDKYEYRYGYRLFICIQCDFPSRTKSPWKRILFCLLLHPCCPFLKCYILVFLPVFWHTKIILH